MYLLPRWELQIGEDERILPANQTPPWPKVFFIKFFVSRSVNVYHPEELIQDSDGEIANFCFCFNPVKAGNTLFDTIYLPMQDFISHDDDGAAANNFFIDMLHSFQVELVSEDQRIVDSFSSKMRSMAHDALARDRTIVPVVVTVKVDMWAEFHPGIFELCIPAYGDKINEMGSEHCVCSSSLQVLIMKTPKLDSRSSDHQEDCPICLVTLDGEQEAIQLPCSHLYHTDCIVEWFQNNSSCPLCRCHVE